MKSERIWKQLSQRDPEIAKKGYSLWECRTCGQTLTYGGMGEPKILCPNCERKKREDNTK